MSGLLRTPVLADAERLKESLSSNEAQRSSKPIDHKESLARTISPVDNVPHSAKPPISIQELPKELFIDVIRSYIDPRSTIRDLIRATLVCKQWRTTVEGTPFLWCRIDGRESLPYVRKGLELSGKCLLDISWDENTSKLDAVTFFGEVEGHIARWKSWVVVCSRDLFWGPLETSPAPALEKLHLDNRYWTTGKKAPITLFGGAPAPLSLKDLRVIGRPIELHLLCPVRLRRFVLADHSLPIAAAVRRVLRESPELEELDLIRLKDQNNPVPDDGPFQLPLLHRINIDCIPIQSAQQLLSNLSTPSLHRLWVALWVPSNPSTEIPRFLGPLIPVMRSTASGASFIDVNFDGFYYAIGIGELRLSFESDGTNGGVLAQELFDWLCSHLGEHLANLPVSLSLKDCHSSPVHAEWLSSRVKVTGLSLRRSPSFWRNSFDNVLSSLSKPNASSSTGWLLPHHEAFTFDLTLVTLGWENLVDMIRARQSAAIRGDQGETGTIAPRPLREIRVFPSYPWLGRKQPSEREVDLLQAIQDAARGADVYWWDEKWP